MKAKLKQLLINILLFLKPSSVVPTKQGSYYSSGTIVAVKTGGCVTLQFNNVSLVALSSRTTIATLPSGYRPGMEVYGMITGTTRYFMVEYNGEIRVEPGSAGSVWGSCTFAAMY